MAKCRSCEAPILWGITDKNAKTMPVDRRPDPKGNVILTGNRIGGKDEVHVLIAGEEVPDGTARYTSHFATCEHADLHRRS